MPPIYNDSYFVEFAPAITNKIDYAYVESNANVEKNQNATTQVS
jgi:hypothetical protein